MPRMWTLASLLLSVSVMSTLSSYTSLSFSPYLSREQSLFVPLTPLHIYNLNTRLHTSVHIYNANRRQACAQWWGVWLLHAVHLSNQEGCSRCRGQVGCRRWRCRGQLNVHWISHVIIERTNIFWRISFAFPESNWARGEFKLSESDLFCECNSNNCTSLS